MSKTTLCVALLSVLSLPLVGCGAGALSGQARVPEHLRTDNDRYAEAFGAAFSRYEGEVELAVSRVYNSRDEAAAVAASCSAFRFRGLLGEELNAHGLTLRGFEQHRAHHPELAAQLEERFSDRLTAVRQTARAIPERLDPLGPWQVAFDSPDQPNRHLATR